MTSMKGGAALLLESLDLEYRLKIKVGQGDETKSSSCSRRSDQRWKGMAFVRPPTRGPAMLGRLGTLNGMLERVRGCEAANSFFNAGKAAKALQTLQKLQVRQMLSMLEILTRLDMLLTSSELRVKKGTGGGGLGGGDEGEGRGRGRGG